MQLVYSLRRGSNGYGVDIDSYNVIVGVHAGGQGSIDGLARSGDAALAVDGAPLTGAHHLHGMFCHLRRAPLHVSENGARE